MQPGLQLLALLRREHPQHLLSKRLTRLFVGCAPLGMLRAICLNHTLDLRFLTLAQAERLNRSHEPRVVRVGAGRRGNQRESSGSNRREKKRTDVHHARTVPRSRLRAA